MLEHGDRRIEGSAIVPNSQRHLVAVWNPAYTTTNAMDAHLRILLRAAAENRDDAYVWWG